MADSFSVAPLIAKQRERQENSSHSVKQVRSQKRAKNKTGLPKRIFLRLTISSILDTDTGQRIIPK